MGGYKKLAGAKDGIPFTKGDSRINRKGRPIKLPDLDTLLAEILSEPIQGKEAMKAILIALRKKALSGDVRAVELLLDRSYGKLRQARDIDLTMDFAAMSEQEIDRIAFKLLNKNQKNGKNDE